MLSSGSPSPGRRAVSVASGHGLCVRWLQTEFIAVFASTKLYGAGRLFACRQAFGLPTQGSRFSEEERTMNETELSRQDRIREAYGRAVGDHDYSPRGIKDYRTIKDILPVIRAAVTDVTLEEVCAVRWEDKKLSHCPIEIEMEHFPYCLQLPTGYPTDPDLIGPFDTHEDAKAFTEAHPERCREADIRCLAHLPSRFSASTISMLTGRASPASWE